MPKFFDDSFSPEHPVLTGEHVRHIGFSLRMRPQEALTVCSCGTDYECEIAEITQDAVRLVIRSAAPCCAEPTVSVTLFQALPKADKLEQIIQKSIELGVTEIVPVLTRRCISRMSAGDFQKKLPRYQKIAQAAAQQSGRGMIPAVAPLHTLEQAAVRMQALEVPLVLYEEPGGGCSFSDVRADAGSYGLCIGSEGGFDPEEIALLRAHNVQQIWLGKRILRCETAPLTALSILMYHTGNLN
ncbi:MAG: 16S rRNA (uracil(1498)-N(3))-methyltransferase [Oscillospiraceae bacterium]|nr:16S rRNA (uracil(1498)-N(3))-methyltransferase [Oscillospiraceae bacterium]